MACVGRSGVKDGENGDQSRSRCGQDEERGLDAGDRDARIASGVGVSAGGRFGRKDFAAASRVSPRRGGDIARFSRSQLGRSLILRSYEAPLAVVLRESFSQLNFQSETIMTNEPKWLPWARELQAIAQCGLTFTKDPYDQERYERLRALSAEIFSEYTDVAPDVVAAMFAEQVGYATPKVDVRGAVFDEAGRVLMVQETADGGRWTLPGGWADVNLTAAENVVKEVQEESGYQVRVSKLAAVWDRTRQGHPVGVFSCCKMFFTCKIIGGAPKVGLETSEVRWFAEHELPVELSMQRVMKRQVIRMFAHHRQPGLATDYD